MRIWTIAFALFAALIAAWSATVEAALTGPGGILCPTGTNPATGLDWKAGDTYHLVFVTSTTTTASNKFSSTYNGFVNTAANASTLTGVPAVVWYAIGSTDKSGDGLAAKDNALISAPVYLLDGVTRIADGFNDMWDGALASGINLNQNGVAVAANTQVWTGCHYTNGTPANWGTNDPYYRSLGSGVGYSQWGKVGATDGAWISAGEAPQGNGFRMYALSEPLTVINFVVPSIWNNPVSGTWNWNDGSNWTGGVPDAAGQPAEMALALTDGNVTVDLQGATRTIGRLTLGNSGTAGLGYVLTGGTLTLNNPPDAPEVRVSSGTHDVSADIALVGNVSVPVAAGGKLTASGVISGDYALTKSLGGTLVLAGYSTFTGGTTVNAGTVQVGSDSQGLIEAITGGPVGKGALTLANGSLSSSDTTPHTILNAVAFTGNPILGDATNNGKLAFGGDADLGGAARTLTVNSDSQFDGVISNGGLTKSGPATLIVTKSNAYTGETTINGGTLQVGNGGSGASINTSSGVALANGVTIVFNHADAASFDQAITGIGTLSKTGSGTLTLAGTNTFSGPTTVHGGVLVGNTASLPSAISLDNSAKVAIDQSEDGAFSKTISGAGGIEKKGSGILTLSAPQSYEGATSITTGTLKLPAPSTLVTQPAGLNPGDPYRLAFVTSGMRNATWQDIADYNFLVNGAAAAVPELGAFGVWKCIGSAGNRTTGVFTNADANTATRAGDPDAPIYRLDGTQVATGNGDLWDGTILAGISVDETGGSASRKVWTGATSNGGRAGDWFLGDTGGGWVYYGVSTGTGSGGGGSAWVDNLGEQKPTPYSFYAISGILIAGASTSVNVLPPATTLRIGLDGSFDLNGRSQQVTSLSDSEGSGGIVVNTNLGTTSVLTLCPSGISATFSGQIQGSDTMGTISLVIDGSGTQALTGANSYSGGTTVKGGTLEIGSAGALPAGLALTIEAGGTVVLSSGLSAGAAAESAGGAAAVPEPATLALLAAGLAGLRVAARRRRK